MTEPAVSNKAAPGPKDKTYEASIDYSASSVQFDFDLWNRNAPKDYEQLTLGKELLSQKQLNLLQI